jgi:hypothetical protein
MKTWKNDIFDRLSRPKRHLSSLSRRRVEDFNHVKTIGMDKLKGAKYFSKFDV